MAIGTHIYDAVTVALDWEVGKWGDVVDAGLGDRKTRWVFKGVIAVGNAVPTKVEVEQAVTVITIANESKGT